MFLWKKKFIQLRHLQECIGIWKLSQMNEIDVSSTVEVKWRRKTGLVWKSYRREKNQNEISIKVFHRVPDRHRLVGMVINSGMNFYSSESIRNMSQTNWTRWRSMFVIREFGWWERRVFSLHFVVVENGNDIKFRSEPIKQNGKLTSVLFWLLKTVHYSSIQFWWTFIFRSFLRLRNTAFRLIISALLLNCILEQVDLAFDSHSHKTVH